MSEADAPTEDLLSLSRLAFEVGASPHAVRRWIDARRIKPRVTLNGADYFSRGIASLYEADRARSANPAGGALAGVEYRGHRATPARKREAPKNG